MPIPVWQVGQVLAASDVNTWFVPQVALKTSTQSVTNSTANVNDTQLLLNFAVSTTYWMQGIVLFDAASGGDFKMNFTIPTGATMNLVTNNRNLSSVATTWGVMNANAVSSNGSGTGTTIGISFSGTVTMGSTAGPIQLVWAQNTSNGTSTRVFPGSALIAYRIG